MSAPPSKRPRTSPVPPSRPIALASPDEIALLSHQQCRKLISLLQTPDNASIVTSFIAKLPPIDFSEHHDAVEEALGQDDDDEVDMWEDEEDVHAVVDQGVGEMVDTCSSSSRPDTRINALETMISIAETLYNCSSHKQSVMNKKGAFTSLAEGMADILREMKDRDEDWSGVKEDVLDWHTAFTHEDVFELEDMVTELEGGTQDSGGQEDVASKISRPLCGPVDSILAGHHAEPPSSSSSSEFGWEHEFDYFSTAITETYRDVPDSEAVAAADELVIGIHNTVDDMLAACAESSRVERLISAFATMNDLADLLQPEGLPPPVLNSLLVESSAPNKLAAGMDAIVTMLEKRGEDLESVAGLVRYLHSAYSNLGLSCFAKLARRLGEEDSEEEIAESEAEAVE